MTRGEPVLTSGLFRRHFFVILAFTLLGGIWSFMALGQGALLHGTILAFFLSGVAVFDISCGMIFDRWLIAMTAVGMVFRLQHELLTACGCGIAAGLLFLFLRRISNGGMGGGDIKLAFVLGLWLSWPGIFIAVIAAFWLGGAAAVVLLGGNKKAMGETIPFGPFLSAGAWIAFMYSDILWRLIQGF